MGNLLNYGSIVISVKCVTKYLIKSMKALFLEERMHIVLVKKVNCGLISYFLQTHSRAKEILSLKKLQFS